MLPKFNDSVFQSVYPFICLIFNTEKIDYIICIAVFPLIGKMWRQRRLFGSRFVVVFFICYRLACQWSVRSIFLTFVHRLLCISGPPRN